ncbi:MAG: hypothetical protein AB1742_00325 [bacterium]
MEWLIVLLLIIVISILVFRSGGIGQALFGGQEPKKRDSGEPAGEDVRQAADAALEKIDSKIETLRSLIREADQKIRALRTINSAAANVLGETAGRSRHADENSHAPDRHATTGCSHDKKAAVIRLSRRGMDVNAIAQETGLGAGEVELILILERSRGKQPP